MVSSNDSDSGSKCSSLEANEHLRKAYLMREVADYTGSLVQLSAANISAESDSEAGLVLLAVKAAQAMAHNDSEALRQAVDSLDSKTKEIKAKASIPTMLVFRAMCELGRARLVTGDTELAGQSFRIALGLAQDEYGKNSLEMIYPSLCLAIYHESQGSNLLALALARDAVDLLRERSKQVNDPSLLLAGLIVINSCSFKERRFQKSLAASDELLSMGVKYSLPLASCERLQQAAVVKMLSLAQLDRLQEAKDQGEVLVEAMEKVQGKYSAHLLEPLCQLATVYERIGSRDKASKCLDQALVVVSHIVEDTPFASSADSSLHDDKAAAMPFKEYQVLNRLSETYFLQGKFVDALKLYPSSMRARYTTYVASSTNIIDMLSKRLAEFSEEHQRKQQK
ncbi:MAG: hypothetical protein WCT03_05140 [Candidatus Obscuribacterales bacterium]